MSREPDGLSCLDCATSFMLLSLRGRYAFGSLIFCVAKRIQIAPGAFRVARYADCPAVQDDLVREENPAWRRDHLHEILLDFDRFGIFREVQPLGDSLNVRVDHDA